MTQKTKKTRLKLSVLSILAWLLPVEVFFSLVSTLFWACTNDRLVAMFSSVLGRDWREVKGLVPGAHALTVSGTRLVQLHCWSVLCREMSKTKETKAIHSYFIPQIQTSQLCSWQCYSCIQCNKFPAPS